MALKLLVFCAALGYSVVAFASEDALTFYSSAKDEGSKNSLSSQMDSSPVSSFPEGYTGGIELSSGGQSDTVLSLKEARISSEGLTSGENLLKGYFERAKENGEIFLSFDDVKETVRFWNATEECVASMSRVIDAMWPIKNKVLDDLKEAMCDGQEKKIEQIEKSLKSFFGLVSDAAKKVNDSILSEEANLTFQTHFQMVELSRPLGEMMDEIKLYCK